MLVKDALTNVLTEHPHLTLALIIQIMNAETLAKDVMILALRDIQSHLRLNIMTRLLPNAGLLVINRQQDANIVFVIMTEDAIIQNIQAENLGGGNRIAIIIAKLLEFLNFVTPRTMTPMGLVILNLNAREHHLSIQTLKKRALATMWSGNEVLKVRLLSYESA